MCQLCTGNNDEDSLLSGIAIGIIRRDELIDSGDTMYFTLLSHESFSLSNVDYAGFGKRAEKVF